MEQNTEFKYDANGDIDLNYYMHKAEKMRAMYLAQQFSDLKAWLNKMASRVSLKSFAQHTHLTH